MEGEGRHDSINRPCGGCARGEIDAPAAVGRHCMSRGHWGVLSQTSSATAAPTEKAFGFKNCRPTNALDSGIAALILGDQRHRRVPACRLPLSKQINRLRFAKLPCRSGAPDHPARARRSADRGVKTRVLAAARVTRSQIYQKTAGVLPEFFLREFPRKSGCSECPCLCRPTARFRTPFCPILDNMRSDFGRV